MGKGANEMSRKDEYDASPTDREALIDDEPDAMDDTEPEQQVVEIRESIEQTRAEMSGTIDELQERLSPSYLKEQVKEQVIEQYEQVKETVREATIGKVEDMVERVSDTVSETRRSVVDTIKANPIPSALVGIGLAWLWMNGRGKSGGENYRSVNRYRGGRGYDETARSYTGGGSPRVGQQGSAGAWDRTTGAASNLASKAGDAVSGVAGQVQETASNIASKAKDTVSGVVGQAQETAGYLVDQAQYQARRVEDRFNVVMRESPLAVGAVALALGTAVGLAVPQTRKENEWMGEARDTLVDKAQSAAHETIEQIQQVAQKVTDEMAGAGDLGSQGAGGQSGQGGRASQQSQQGAAGKGNRQA
jgi:cell division septum initiation protein DivIVA